MLQHATLQPGHPCSRASRYNSLSKMARSALASLLALIFSMGLALAGTPWTATYVKGTAISLVGDKWQEIVRGQVLVDVPLRTLRSGRVTLTNGDIELQLGPKSVTQLGTQTSGQSARARHYLGDLKVSSVASTAQPVSIQAGNLLLTELAGEIDISISQSAIILSVRNGDLSVRTGSGGVKSLSVGTYLADPAGNIVSRPTSEPDAASSQSLNGSADPASPKNKASQAKPNAPPGRQHTNRQGPLDPASLPADKSSNRASTADPSSNNAASNTNANPNGPSNSTVASGGSGNGNGNSNANQNSAAAHGNAQSAGDSAPANANGHQPGNGNGNGNGGNGHKP